MASLSFAGALSGAGNAAGGALNQAQAGFNAASIQAERDKLEETRLKMHLDANAALQTQHEGFLDRQGAGSQASAEKIAREHNQVLRDLGEQQITEQASIAHGVNEVAKTHMGILEKHYTDMGNYYKGLVSVRGAAKQINDLLKDLPESNKEAAHGALEQLKSVWKRMEGGTTDDLNALEKKYKAEFLGYLSKGTVEPQKGKRNYPPGAAIPKDIPAAGATEEKKTENTTTSLLNSQPPADVSRVPVDEYSGHTPLWGSAPAPRPGAPVPGYSYPRGWSSTDVPPNEDELRRRALDKLK